MINQKELRSNLRIWSERANSEEKTNQALIWKRKAIDFHKKMVDKYNLSNEAVGEIMSACHKKSHK